MRARKPFFPVLPCTVYMVNLGQQILSKNHDNQQRLRVKKFISHPGGETAVGLKNFNGVCAGILTVSSWV